MAELSVEAGRGRRRDRRRPGRRSSDRRRGRTLGDRQAHPTASASPGASGARQPLLRCVRTDLTTTVQVGGSIGYDRSYTIVAPSGVSTKQVDPQAQHDLPLPALRRQSRNQLRKPAAAQPHLEHIAGSMALQPAHPHRRTISRRPRSFCAPPLPPRCRLHLAAPHDVAPDHRRQQRVLPRSLDNPFANGGSSYTQNRFQVGVRLPISASFSIRPTTYYSR